MLQSNERIVKHKIGLLNLAEELSNVSKACKIMGLPRDPFYRYKAAEGNAFPISFHKFNLMPNLATIKNNHVSWFGIKI